MSKGQLTVGWREWLALPELGIPAIKAKIDTGARTSALHTFMLETFEKENTTWVKFGIHPIQKRRDVEIFSEVPVLARRVVRDSGGHTEERFVISTEVAYANSRWPIELTLTNREDMLFRMLLGRTAMKRRLIVDPARSYLNGKDLQEAYHK